MEINLKEMFGLETLGMRESGLEVRKVMDKAFENNEIVLLNFEGIDMITQGFGDELVGVFVRRKGLEFVKENIKVINANNFIRGTLNWVVSYSKKQ